MSIFQNPALDLKKRNIITSSAKWSVMVCPAMGAPVWDAFYLQKTLPINSAPTSPRTAPR